MQKTTQEMADDCIRMACAESRYMKIPQPSGEQSINKNILIADRSATVVAGSCHVWHCLHATSHCPNSTMPDRTSLLLRSLLACYQENRGTPGNGF